MAGWPEGWMVRRARGDLGDSSASLAIRPSGHLVIPS
jgi:hypothetical protein